MMHMRMFETGRETGFRDMDPEEAYDLGCKDGYRKGYRDAMRKASEEIGFRDGDRPMEERYPERGRMGFRDDGDSSGFRDGGGYSGGMGERRRRDSWGRYM